MYSKEIQRLQWQNSINTIKLVLFLGLIIIGLVIHTSIWLHIVIVSIAVYYFISTLSNLSNNYKKIKKNLQNEEDEKYNKKWKQAYDKKWKQAYDKYDDFNKILDDLYEQAQKQQRQQQYQFHTPFQNTNKLTNAYLLFKLPSTSTTEEIKTKYRELAFKWHPDRWTTDTISNQNTAKRNFQKLQAAYDLIKKDKGIN